MEVIMNADGQRTEKRRNVRQVMAKTFVMVPAQLLSDVADKKITGSAFALYCYLLFRQGKKKQYWGSIEDICWGTGVSSAQVSRLLKQLVARNHISRVKRIGATWITYCLTRVEDGGKIVFRGGLIGDPFIDATMGRNSKNKPIASDSKLA